MKKYLLLVLAMILALSLMLSLSSCEIVIGGGTPTPPDEPTEDDDDEIPEDPEDEPEDEPEAEYSVKFMYYYGNMNYQNTTIATLKVNSATGFTADQINAIDNFTYHGYGFDGWYQDRELLSEYDFDSSVSKDITLYAKYDKSKAGKNVTWHLSSDATTLQFKGTGPMYDYEYQEEVPWRIYLSKVKSVTFEEGITNIGAHSVAAASKITSLYIPASVKSIGKNAFMQCTGLTSITHANAGFKINGKSTTVSFPDTLEIIGEGAFKQCTGISGMIIFGDGLRIIGDNAFYLCDNAGTAADDITDIVIPKSLENIGATAFYGAENLKRVFFKGAKSDYNIAYGVDNYYVRDIALTYYYSENKPAVAGAYWYYFNEQGATPEIRQYYFALRYKTPTGVDSSKFTYEFNDWVEITDVKNNKGYCTPANQTFRDRIEKDGYKYKNINEAIVTNYNDITKNTAITADKEFILYRGNILADGHGVVIAYNGTTVTVGLHMNFDPKTMSSEIWDFDNVEASKYFWDATSARMLHEDATALNINSGVTYIGKYAFARMTQLKELIIPASVKAIHKDAFHGSSNLINIYYNGEGLKIVDDFGNEVATIDGCGNAQVYWKTSMSTISEGGWWMKTAANKYIAWYYDGEKLSIGGDVMMDDFASYEDTPWYGVNAKELVIRPATIKIAANLVNGVESIEKITIPNTVRIIPASAFAGTKAVTQAKDSGDGAFYIDGHLIKVVDPSKVGTDFQLRIGVYSIAENTFANCPNLRSIYVSSTVAGIHKNAFKNASALERIYFAGVPAVWNNALQPGFALPNGVEMYYQTSSKPTISGWENYNWFKMVDGKIEVVDFTKQ